MGAGPLITLCPHCEARAKVRSSRTISRLVRESYYQCSDVECGHTFVAQISVIRTISPSAKPRAGVAIPFGVNRVPMAPRAPPAPANDPLPIAVEA